MSVNIEMTGLSELERAWALAPEMVTEELTAAMWQAEMLLQREVQDLTPVGVGGAGGLRGSIHAQDPQVLANSVLGMVGTSLAYAVPVELGTAPHWAPIAPILDWVRQKLGVTDTEALRVANAVRSGIAQHGTPAVGMFHKAFNANRSQVQRMFEMAGARIVARLG